VKLLEKLERRFDVKSVDHIPTYFYLTKKLLLGYISKGGPAFIVSTKTLIYEEWFPPSKDSTVALQFTVVRPKSKFGLSGEVIMGAPNMVYERHQDTKRHKVSFAKVMDVLCEYPTLVVKITGV